MPDEIRQLKASLERAAAIDEITSVALAVAFTDQNLTSEEVERIVLETELALLEYEGFYLRVWNS